MADVRDSHLHILHRLDMVKGTDMLKNYIDMKPIAHRLDEYRRRWAALGKEPPRPCGQTHEAYEPCELTRARLIAAVEQIKLICEAHKHTDSAKVDLVHNLARQLVNQWDNEK
jgi:hypothetical protein